MTITDLYLKRFDKNFYNCAHFVCDAWRVLVGESVDERMPGFLVPLNEKQAPMDLRRRFERLREPESPCIAIFSKPNTSPHAGLFIERKVLHLSAKGVFHEPLETLMLNFNTVRFYR